MKESITVRPDKIRLINLLEDIKNGSIKIPIFQRDFVWDSRQMKELFDSMEKGYPIGSLLFWKPEEEFNSIDKIGPYIIDKQSKDVKYILDGFQRLSTLFGVLAHPKANRLDNQNSRLKDFQLFYDLSNEEFTYSRSRNNPPDLIPLYILIDTFEFLGFIDDLRKKIVGDNEQNRLIIRAKNLVKILVDYEIPFVDIKGGDINSSVDIFSRINSRGTQISPDWMVSALSYNPNQNFLFSSKIDSLLTSLEEYNFEQLSRETILHCIESATDKIYFDVKIEDLSRRSDFPQIVNQTLDTIEKAVRFLNSVHVIEYRLLPYNTQLIFLSEFYRLNPTPTNHQIALLKKWFWITSYSNYFTIYSLSKQRMALEHFKCFAMGKKNDPVFYLNHDSKLSTYPFPDRIDFGSVRSKTFMLFLLSQVNNLFNKDNSNLRPSLDIRYLSTEIRNTKSVFFNNSVINENLQLLKKNDGSLMLEQDNVDYESYFINNEIIRLLEQGNTQEAIDLRFELIRKSEKQFVKNIGLLYSE
ncbi:MAG TPA: DUF262 domain-containing protein [Prolixibacteraceae bacterium]|nr:DUF262 domain-containing protein [Prolixibacteraceae bacterium]